MGSQLSPVDDQPVYSHRGLQKDIRTFIRRLLKEAENDKPHAREAPRQDGLLLDLEVDGVRCVLMRAASQPHDVHSLSPREKEIARMVGRGYPNKTIAAVLEISPWTVCTHLRRLFAKLNVTSRAAMIAKLAKDRQLDWSAERQAAAPEKMLPAGRH